MARPADMHGSSHANTTKPDLCGTHARPKVGFRGGWQRR